MASKTLKLSYLASWACVSLLCQAFVEKSKGFPEELSEVAVVDFVRDAYLKCAFCFEVLYQCAHNDKVISIFVDSLQKWTIAGKTLKSLPSPLSLVNEWFKIECRVSRNEDEEYSARTTYCLLYSSEELSKSTTNTLLEQVLLSLSVRV